MRTCFKHHPSPVKTCKVCCRYMADPVYRAAMDRFMEKVLAGLPIVPPVCVHRGPLIPLDQRYDKGLGTIRDWHECALGYGTDGYVCPCNECNTGCPGYESPEKDSQDTPGIEHVPTV